MCNSFIIRHNDTGSLQSSLLRREGLMTQSRILQLVSNNFAPANNAEELFDVALYTTHLQYSIQCSVIGTVIGAAIITN